MTLSASTVQSEHDKFVENSNGDTAIRAVIDPAQITTITPPASITGYATETKQDTGNSSLSSIDSKLTQFNTNHIDDYTTTSVTYIGKEDSAGVWFIKKIDETGNFPVVTYATVTNNPTLTTYALGWAARTTATYGTYAVAF